MDIVIPTYGRRALQMTAGQLIAAGLRPTFVVQDRERHLWKGVDNVAVLPLNIVTIAPTRDWIRSRIGDDNVLCMIDDDLIFYKRRDDDRKKLRGIRPDELHSGFAKMDLLLRTGRYAHAGFAAREGANRNEDSYVYNTRIMRVLGYDRSLLAKIPVQFGDVKLMEDFHVSLTLLEWGYQNVILNEYAHNQGGSDAAGGCSTYRTPEMQTEAAKLLQKLHPSYVKLTTKTTKTAWGGGTRTDVQIYWKKAYHEATGLRTGILDRREGEHPTTTGGGNEAPLEPGSVDD